MITAFYTAKELASAKRVYDHEVDSLLQEIRAKDDRYYLIEKKRTIKKGWFKKPIEETLYEVIFDTGYGDCQILNFCDREFTIKTDVPKELVITLFLGWLNGYNRFKEQTKKKVKQ